MNHLVTVDAADNLVLDVKRVSKTCRTCEQDKPLTAFDAYGLSKDGLYRDCKSCRAKMKAANIAMGRRITLRDLNALVAAPAPAPASAPRAEAETPAAAPASVIARAMPAAPAVAVSAPSLQSDVIALLDLVVTTLGSEDRVRLARLIAAYDA